MRIFHRSRRFSSALWVLLAAALTVAPAAAQDAVSGTFSFAGKTYKLTHVNVSRQPLMTDNSKIVFVVLLTDNPIPAKVLNDRFRLELTDLAREGKFHGVSVTIGADRKPVGTSWNYAKEFGGAMITRADQHTFEAKALDDSHAEGQLFGQGSIGDDKWDYSASCKTALTTSK